MDISDRGFTFKIRLTFEFNFFWLGHQFPTLKEADAMFLAEKAPEWKDGDCCHRCRVMFGMVQRKVRYCFIQ